MENPIPTVEDKPAELQAVDELRADAKTPEDHAYLDKVTEQVKAERAQLLGGPAVRTQELPDGTNPTLEELKKSQENDEEPSGPYNGGQR
ncbi:MAG: hypothetical protein U5L95_02150 [Candidatus Saccharibacteria bacterium]|nr:hypothetical protein [Candidatus Saccharibacteria bacterium]